MNSSLLFDEKSFYPQFVRDLYSCQREAIIESPFISSERMQRLYPVIKELVEGGIKVFVFTRNPKDHTPKFAIQSEKAIRQFEALGVQVFVCQNNHHRKLAILDRKILWEGSLNILSQIKSREIMRRIDSGKSAVEMFDFLKLGRFI